METIYTNGTYRIVRTIELAGTTPNELETWYHVYNGGGYLNSYRTYQLAIDRVNYPI